MDKNKLGCDVRYLRLLFDNLGHVHFILCATSPPSGVRTAGFLSPIAAKLRKGDIGLPFVRQSVRPSVHLGMPDMGSV